MLFVHSRESPGLVLTGLQSSGIHHSATAAAPGLGLSLNDPPAYSPSITFKPVVPGNEQVRAFNAYDVIAPPTVAMATAGADDEGYLRPAPVSDDQSATATMAAYSDVPDDELCYETVRILPDNDHDNYYNYYYYNN